MHKLEKKVSILTEKQKICVFVSFSHCSIVARATNINGYALSINITRALL